MVKTLLIQSPESYIEKWFTEKTKIGGVKSSCCKAALLSTLLWGFFAYHLLVITGVGNADAVCEGLYSYTAADWALACGRWCARYFYGAVGNVVMPGVWVTLYMLCVFASVLLIARLWRFESPLSVFFAAALLAVNPTVIEQSLLQYMFMSWGLSNLLGIAFVYAVFMSDSRLVRCLVAPVGMAVAFGFYQASVGLIALVFGLTLILRLLRGMTARDMLKYALRFVVSAVIGAAEYFVVLRYELNRWGVAESDRVGAFSLREIFTSLGETVPDAYRFFFAYFDDPVFRRKYIAFALGAILLLLFLRRLWLIVKERHYIEGVCAVLLFALIPALANICRVIFPYFTVVTIMEYQIMLLVPFAFALGEEHEARFENVLNLTRIVAFALSLVLVAGYTVSANATYRAYDLSYRHAQYETGEIVRRARALDDYVPGETVMFVGFIRDDTLREKNGVYNYAYGMYDNLIFWEEYMGITSGRQNFALDTLGVDIGEVDMAQYVTVTASEEFAEMPVYPAAGSVARIDGVIVAKLTDDPIRFD